MIFQGKVHVYYGDGKGKTTAAVGLAVRAFGAGFDVLAAQFLKDGRSPEMNVLRDQLKIPVYAEKMTPKMSYAMTEDEKEQSRASHEKVWQAAMDWAASSGLQLYAGRLLVLDEVLGAIESGLFPEGKLIDFLDHRPADLEVVITGRNPSAQILERADYRSRISCDGHPFNNGTGARKGIEF